MKNLKKVLALVLAVVMIMGTVAVASAKDFKDVKATDNYAEAIDVLSNLGIIDGFTDGEYKPEGTFTRAQAAKMVAIVHNAATNGKIKGQDAISDLYGNAQNAFTDCTGNWAVAYINYCRATGLLDGITRTTYAPNSKLTGVQWLKLMLTTLNFNTDKEGYLGAGWDIHVLNRANEIGLLEGMPENWKGEAAVTRGEAAQILYNALTAYLVEYGQLIKGYPTTEAEKNGKYPYKASFVSNEQVNKTGMTLAKKMGVGLTYAHDVFMRPGYVWSYGSWTAFYLKSAAKTYTGKVTACDILVDLGYAKTSKDSVKFVYYRNGSVDTLDGYTTAANELTHVGNKCEFSVAGNGALTQVFKMVVNKEVVYLVTTIDTMLAQVTKVVTTKHGMNNIIGTELTVFAPNYTTDRSKYSIQDLSATSAFKGFELVAPGLTDYAKGDYILTYASVDPTARTAWYGNLFGYETLYKADTKVWDNTNKAVYDETKLAAEVYLVPMQKAGTIESGKYTGRSLPDMDELTVNGEKYNANCTYSLNEANKICKNTTLVAATLDFFVDQYGNLIGNINPASAAKNYAVVTGIVWLTDGKTYSDAQKASAALVKAGENKTEDFDIYAANLNTATTDKMLPLSGVENNYGSIGQHTVSTVKGWNYWYENNDPHNNTYGVVSYTTNTDGSLNLTYNVGTILEKDGARVKTLNQTQPNLGGTGYVADEHTIFTVRTKDATGADVYTSYTGIANVPSIREATAIVAVKEAGKTYVPFVYVDATNAIFAGSTTLAFVVPDEKANYEDTTTRYSYYNVYINGVKTTVEVDKVLAEVIATTGAENVFGGTGLYKLYFNSEGKVIKTELVYSDTIGTAPAGYGTATVTDTSDVVATTGIATNYTLNTTNAKVYVVTYHHNYTTNVNTFVGVAEGKIEDVTAGAKVWYKLAAGSEWMAETLYVFVED